MGCGRALSEIRDWGAADDAERNRILGRAAVRRRERAERLRTWSLEPPKP
jgi:predicted Fe-S protein YdhL (DUF1289 family)